MSTAPSVVACAVGSGVGSGVGSRPDPSPAAKPPHLPRRHRGLRRPRGVVLHTRPDDEDVPTVWEGLPLTAPARTLVDVVDDLQPEQAAMAVRQALSGAD